jgi:hypothetical protein
MCRHHCCFEPTRSSSKARLAAIAHSRLWHCPLTVPCQVRLLGCCRPRGRGGWTVARPLPLTRCGSRVGQNAVTHNTAFRRWRREFMTLLVGATAWPLAARAQQQNGMRRIGMLAGLAEDDPEQIARIAAFRQGLARLGWVEGRNVRIDFRFAPSSAQLQVKGCGSCSRSRPAA